MKKNKDKKGDLNIPRDFQNDEEINQQVFERFKNEPELDIKKIGAECEKGVVILRGQASSLGEIELAKELAVQVPGVKEVRTLIKFSKEVKDFDDAYLVNAVEIAFSASDIVEAEDIDTQCTKAIVTLRGTVDTKEQKEAAEVIAKTVPGVKKVYNELKTRHDNSEGDEYLTNVLRKALNEEGGVSPAQVKCVVVKRIAFLSGKVYSIDTKEKAEEIARETKGITQVINDITVSYH